MDIIELHRFYETPLGRLTRARIAAALRRLTPPPRDGRVVGLGYATPWLDTMREKVRETFAFMPAHQGAMRWPTRGMAATALVDEAALPLPDASIDLVLVVHALELTPARARMMREIWRVLSPSGHAVFIVPNRAGVWARRDAVPFGHGRPFSRRQMERLLADAMFTPLNVQPLLFSPPSQRRLLLRVAPLLERAGPLLWQGFSGLLMVEAIKQVYALTPRRESAPALPGLRPVPAPAMRAASRAPLPHS